MKKTKNKIRILNKHFNEIIYKTVTEQDPNQPYNSRSLRKDEWADVDVSGPVLGVQIRAKVKNSKKFIKVSTNSYGFGVKGYRNQYLHVFIPLKLSKIIADENVTVSEDDMPLRNKKAK